MQHCNLEESVFSSEEESDAARSHALYSRILGPWEYWFQVVRDTLGIPSTADTVARPAFSFVRGRHRLYRLASPC